MPKEKYSHSVDILKVDQDEQKVFGIFNMSTLSGEPVLDRQGDFISTSELEKATHNFVLEARVSKESHQGEPIGRLIEAVVFTKEKAEILQESLIKMGANAVIRPDAEFVFGGFKIDSDEAWELIKSGQMEDFSIGGTANKTPVE